MAYKNFEIWHQQKSILSARTVTRYFYEREVWWVSIGHNIGAEEDGKGMHFARPVLVLRKFNKTFFYGLPLSTTTNRGKYYHPFQFQGGTSVALLSHLRDYDARRLVNKIGALDAADYAVIRNKLIEVINSSI